MRMLAEVDNALREQKRKITYLRRGAASMAEKYSNTLGLSDGDIAIGQMAGKGEEETFELWGDVGTMPTTYGDGIDFVLQWRYLTNEVNSAPINVRLVAALGCDSDLILVRLKSEGDEHFHPVDDKAIYEAITKDILNQIRNPDSNI